MKDLSNRSIFISVSLLIVIGLVYIAMQMPWIEDSLNESEPAEISYYTVYDEKQMVVLETGWPVSVDDRFINEQNTIYKINRVEENQAWAEMIDNNDDLMLEKSRAHTSFFSHWFGVLPVKAAAPHVVVYHTHTDESYATTSKTQSDANGDGVIQVGNRFAEQLLQNGVSVTHSENLHDPHDINAYNRSRKTLAQLLKEQPDAAFDIHRDSAPTSAYLTTINGLLCSRVMIVVGRSNPHISTNLQYAKDFKAAADEIYPGFMRGIFLGKGSYNQDLYPTALLFEVGTETISQDLAESAATCLADIMRLFLIP